MNPQLPWHRQEQVIWMMSATELTSLATARSPSQQGLPSAQQSSAIYRKWNRGSCPLPSAVTSTCALHGRSQGTSPPGLPTHQHISQGPSHREASQAMSAVVIPLIRGTMVGLLLKCLKPFPNHSVMTIKCIETVARATTDHHVFLFFLIGFRLIMEPYQRVQ